MSGHTPSPWVVGGEDSHAEGIPFIEIQEINQLGWTLASVEAIWVDDDLELTSECWANAHLIAAAPDLLEALEGLLDDWLAQYDTWTPEAREELTPLKEKALAVIRKAKGERHE